MSREEEEAVRAFLAKGGGPRVIPAVKPATKPTKRHSKAGRFQKSNALKPGGRLS